MIDNVPDVEILIEYLKDFDYIAYDCETTGVDKSAEVIGISVCVEEDKAFYVIMSVWDVETQTLVRLDTHDAAKRLVEALKGKQVICHNAIFDCIIAESFFKVRLIDSIHTDTMVAAHLLDENRRIGLKELGVLLFGDDAKTEATAMKASVEANGGSLTKKNYEMYKADPYLMGEYGAKDTLLTFKLFNTFVPQLIDEGLYDFFYNDECMPLLRGPTYELNNTGLKVDMAGMQSLKLQLTAECAEAKEFIYREIAEHIKDMYPGTSKKNTFNIGSSSQLSWLLFGQLALEFGTLTKAGKTACKELGLKLPYTFAAQREFIRVCQNLAGTTQQPDAIVNGSKVRAKKFKQPWAYIACDKKTLAKIAPRLKWVEKLLEYQRKIKILNTYVEGIGGRVRYGVIHPSFLQTGTSSGRYSSRNPNFQNLPRDDKRVKACIVARSGKVFVGADYSQLEPRVFAYISGDTALKDAFNGTNDFYSVIGMKVYGKHDCTPHKEGSPDAFGVKYKKLRDLSKVIALATAYGATAPQLMATTGKSKEDTQADMNAYLEEFPMVAEMQLKAHEMAKTQGYVVNMFGRKRRIPEALRIGKLYGMKTPHADLPYEARNLLNLAVNHPIQATGASIVNRSAIRFHKLKAEAGIDAKLVVQVHDSLVVECMEADAPKVRELLREAMENTVVLDGVKLEASPIIGESLAKV